MQGGIFLPIRSKFKEVKCPDGTKRNILKDPKEAFQTEFSTWETKVKAIANILSDNKADVDAEVKKKTESIVQGLTETYATMQAQYCSAYLGYWSNPCDKETERAWKAEREKILKKQTILEKMEKKLKTQLKAEPKLPPITEAPTKRTIKKKQPARYISKVSEVKIKNLAKLYSEFSE